MAGFKRFKEQRQALLDEVMTGVLPNLPTGRSSRTFVIGDNSDAAILTVSALLIYFMQARGHPHALLFMRCPHQAFPVCDFTPSTVHIMTDGFLLQVSVELPSLEVEAGALRNCYAPVMHWADVFWTTCLSRCSARNSVHFRLLLCQ